MERYRIQDDASVYFVTYSIVEWLPVFVSEPAFKIITDSFSFCHREKNLRINAFVVMPTHLHAIVFDADFDNSRLERSLTDFRKFTGRKLSDHCAKNCPPTFVDVLRREAGEDRERRFWQPSRHPVAIFGLNFWRQKLDYLHDNPRRKGLVTQSDHWRYSSARWYETDAAEPSEVLISQIEW